MADNEGLFERYVELLPAEQVKAMAAAWGSQGHTSKPKAIDFMCKAINDPAAVEKVLSGLDPTEHAALTLAKQGGGSIQRDVLHLFLVAVGLAPADRMLAEQAGGIHVVADSLQKKGLLIPPVMSYYGSYYLRNYLQDVELTCDPRVLDVLEPLLPVTPLPVAAIYHADVAVYRSVPSVVLDIVGCLRAIEDLGGIGITKQGLPRVTELRKLQRAMKWPSDNLEIDGLRFDAAFQGLFSALEASGLLTELTDRLAVALPLAEVANLGYVNTVVALFGGFVNSSTWREPIGDSYTDTYGSSHSLARLVLTLALKSLPPAADGYYSLEEFEKAYFERIGEYFSIRLPRVPPHLTGRKVEDATKLVSGWRAKIRTEWLSNDRIWIEKALTGWLYFLGMVEIGLREGKAKFFRLTPFGQTVLDMAFVGKPAAAVPVAASSDPGEVVPAWVVQPNFDIVVYLDRVTASQLALIERIAERTSAQQHLAHYQLTRESVYRGLESGLEINGLLADLQRGAHADLPQNVLFEAREWAALRERISVHRRGHFLEFRSADERNAAVAAGLKGKPLGERFWLVAVGDVLTVPDAALAPLKVKQITRVNYAGALPQSLSITEDGVVTIRREQRDLLIEAQIGQWADRITDQEWRLTAERISKAVKNGSRLSELMALLNLRLSHQIPPLLNVVLRNWADRRTPVEVGEVAVLRCMNLDVMNTIKKSAKFRPFIRGELGPDTLLVDATRLDELRALVKWAGMGNQ